MVLLDFMHPSSSQAVVAAEPAVQTEADEPVAITEAAKGTELEPEAAAMTNVVESSEDAQVDPQPTLSHAEAGTAHSAEQPVLATASSNLPTEEAKPAEDVQVPEAPKEEVHEEKKEDGKSATKAKAEKTKVEGKGFFAKFFGAKDKSPKKEKKVKTPKMEKSEPIVDGTSPEETAPPVTEASEETPVAKVEDVPEAPVLVPETSAAGPITEPSTSASAILEPEVTKVPETIVATPASPKASTTVTPIAAPSAAEAAVESAPVGGEMIVSKGEAPKAPKASRRLSARFTGAIKHFGRKEYASSPKDEVPQEQAEATMKHATPSTVSNEAPQLEKPIETEPLSVETESSAPTSVPAPAVTTTV